TKVAAHYSLTVGAGAREVVRLRLSNAPPGGHPLRGNGKGGSTRKKAGAAALPFGSAFHDVMDLRHKEADEFYGSITPASLSSDAAECMRQALAGMMWSKQFSHYD